MSLYNVELHIVRIHSNAGKRSKNDGICDDGKSNIRRLHFQALYNKSNISNIVIIIATVVMAKALWSEYTCVGRYHFITYN